MEPLFRLMLVRPAVAQDPENPSIDLTQNSPLQDGLRHLPPGDGQRGGAKRLGAGYAGSADFIGNPDENPFAAQLAKLAAELDRLEAVKNVKPKDLRDAIEASFGAAAKNVVQDDNFARMLARLRDSLLAIKLLQDEHGRPIEQLARQLRTAEVVSKAAAEAAFPAEASALRRWRRRSLKLPLTLAGSTVLSTREKEDQIRKQRRTDLENRRKQVDEKLDHYHRLNAAIREISSVPSSHFRETAQTISPAALPPDRLRLIASTEEQAAHGTEFRKLQLEQIRRGIEARAGEKGTAVQPSTPVSTMSARVLPGRPGFTPVSLPESGFVLTAAAATQLSAKTATMLKERGVDLTTIAVDKAVERLQGELAATASDLEHLAGHPVKQSFMRLGDALISIQTPLLFDLGKVVPGSFPTVNLPMPIDGRIPHAKGDIAPAGVADLLVVKQQLIGYEAADVAHIENVLKGERKAREHTHREQVEVVTLTESEVTKSEEHELESTDRFEMTRETAVTIKEDISVKAGLKISGKYGPAVEFAVSAEGAYNRTKEEATKTAAKFSQDVTERTARKIAERVLQRTQTTTTTETVEKNTHELNNVPGAGHISGVYQWVNKVYQAQMFNYGLRTMFDFMVPEPAAFMIATMANAHNSATTLVKPPPFTLTPSQVTETNYGYWVNLTQATDVVPPPELYKTKSADFKAGGGEDDANYNHSGQIAIDDGYRAIFGSVGIVRNVWESDNTLDVVLGRRTQRMAGSDWMWTTSLDDERDTIPFALDTFHCSQVAIAIEVKCVRTDRAMEKWRLETHAKLQTAHKALVAKYEEDLAALKLQAGVAIHGNNPAANRVTIEAELKKNCISVLTDQHFDLFNAVDNSPTNGLPEIDVLEAAGEGPYVRFFEQAFEWEHLSYVMYPYFWGRKDQWDERVAYDDPDPAFAEFLKAGYCRVTVPARPGFEGAIDHFMTFGEAWNGGPLPPISSPLYLPIADEIAERLDRPGDEVPQGDPWKVRIPTNLVHLRADDTLPEWEQDAQGEWVEA